MDPLEARLKCLELAVTSTDEPTTATAILATAKTFSEFVIGDPVKSSASFGKAKGADDPK